MALLAILGCMHASSLAATLQLLGATSRFSILCAAAAEPSSSSSSDTTAANETNSTGGFFAPSRKCFAVVEARLGKSVKRLALWVSQHRRAQKAASKNVKGAKELHYRKDRQGSLWLSLRFAPGAAEQHPGSPYLNFTSGASFPLPLTAQSPWWEVDGEPLDSRGRPKAEKQPMGSVLSTM